MLKEANTPLLSGHLAFVTTICIPLHCLTCQCTRERLKPGKLRAPVMLRAGMWVLTLWRATVAQQEVSVHCFATTTCGIQSQKHLGEYLLLWAFPREGCASRPDQEHSFVFFCKLLWVWLFTLVIWLILKFPCQATSTLSPILSTNSLELPLKNCQALNKNGNRISNVPPWRANSTQQFT